MTKNRIVAIGVEDSERPGEWVQIPTRQQSAITCPNCETFAGVRQKMLKRDDHYYCPKCGLIILKPEWGAI